MKHRSNGEDLSVGEDSFLDTTANLVGILIIIVVIVGAKAKVSTERHFRQQAEAERKQGLEEPLKQVALLEQTLLEQAVTISEYELEAEYRRLERQALLEKVVLARAEVKEKLDKLDGQQRQAIEKEGEIDKLQSELDKLQALGGANQESPRPKIVLEHLPTPMARTVFQKELHVVLKAGSVIVVPWDRLIEVLKQQIPLAAQRQASRNKLEDKIGPVGGFVMMYRMAAVPGGFELDRFELEPTQSVPVDSIKDTMQSTSRLSIEMASRNPRETVVTVWVYPDSFDHFRKLKAWLFSQGFLCAARPLPDGVRVGGSPQGSRSTAQ
jgi:hypothetical protein